ncbi:MAG: YidC/Oxa1 family membrane protein insertase [Sphaerobacter sp.]|nr:YidC/Oxa1 family membrane protein insertase [Sphaerobacter sp.]
MPIWNEFVGLIEFGLRYLADHTGSAGLSVIVFTILLKTVLLPLTVKAVRSTSAMQEIQPKLKELQKKYGKDRQRLSQETMKLYQEHGINPAAGCLPLLLQMPIFFGLYFAIRSLSESGTGTWANPFLWLPSLASPDPFHLLPILAGLFQLMQTKMTRPAGQGKITDPQQQMMNTMMMFMPLMVIAFGWNFPSGPVLYWAVSALYSVIQQWFITGWGSLLDWMPFLPDLPEHRRLGYQDPAKRAAAREKAKNSWFARLNARIQQQMAEPGSGGGARPGAAPEPVVTPAASDGGRTKKRAERAAPPPPTPRPDLVPRKTRPRKRDGSAD